ncbi:MAG: type II toxin-antitoxin system VapC family toxin [Candidatus Heimdallarchaeota archaeon]|nr:MAG: type II toxin-antitoxin system VapC family toxin [Candidatus Heimdallarchaeota archaeon]
MLIDTNIFLEVQLNQEKAQRASEILKAVFKNIIRAYITDFTVDSIAIIMEHYNKSPAEIKRFFVSLLAYEGLEFYQLSIFDKIEATEHMRSLQLDFDDACMYQAMQVLKITTIASFDTDFDKIPNIKRLVSLP